MILVGDDCLAFASSVRGAGGIEGIGLDFPF